MEQPKDLNCLVETLLAFYKERDWEKFHSPKNLVMNLASETGELLDHFRWLTEEESYKLGPETRQEVSDEIADVFQSILALAEKLGIDPIQATYHKLK